MKQYMSSECRRGRHDDCTGEHPVDPEHKCACKHHSPPERESLTVTVESISYEVTAYPFHDMERHHFTLMVKRKGPDSWGLYDRMDASWNRVTKQWDYEPLPSAREDEWLVDHRYPSAEEAIADAREIAPFITLMGWTLNQTVRLAQGEEICGVIIVQGIRCDKAPGHEGDHTP